MDLTLSPDEEAFRDELRTWLEENHPGEEPKGDEEAAFAFRVAWQKKLHAGGWAGLSFQPFATPFPRAGTGTALWLPEGRALFADRAAERAFGAGVIEVDMGQQERSGLEIAEALEQADGVHQERFG